MNQVFEHLKEKNRIEDANRAAAEAFFGKSYDRKFSYRPKVAKPICAHCGKRYGVRVEEYIETSFRIGEPVPQYRGNLRVVREWLSVGGGMGPNGKPGARLWRYLWDGVSYAAASHTDPFCTLTCAATFAKAAHAAGYRSYMKKLP